MAIYVVKEPVEVNGDIYEVGTQLSLDSEQAEVLGAKVELYVEPEVDEAPQDTEEEVKPEPPKEEKSWVGGHPKVQ